jgi:hypothetical protein
VACDFPNSENGALIIKTEINRSGRRQS